MRISIHALRGEGDSSPGGPGRLPGYFYPRPPWGGRRAASKLQVPTCRFLSTPSVGRATYKGGNFFGLGSKFLSTPSVGRATSRTISGQRVTLISIHALRGEGDCWDRTAERLIQISIHALRGEGDGPMRHYVATVMISIHALRGEGDRRVSAADQDQPISIHALRGEGDSKSA